MKTLYLDVYFLINLTVNLLALYFACRFSKVKTTQLRLLISSATGAVFACITALLTLNFIFFVLLLVLSSLLIVFITAGRITALLRFKLFASFLVFETLLGGFVSFAFGFLDEHFLPIIENADFSPENKRLLLLSLIVLLSIGLLRILFAVFDGKREERIVNISFDFLGKKISLSAFVDSGNLLKDPMDLKPVILIKEDVLAKRGIAYSSLFDNPEAAIAARIRIIPAKGVGGAALLYGIRTDEIRVKYEKKNLFASAVIAIDREQGSYAGYEALVPSVFLGEK